MKEVNPKEKLLHLPYSKQIVSTVYFDAREVFTSLLSCPTMNQDENLSFHGSRQATKCRQRWVQTQAPVSQNQSSMSGLKSCQRNVESQETPRNAPLVIVVTGSRKTSQLRLSFMNVNAKPKKNLNNGKRGYIQEQCCKTCCQWRSLESRQQNVKAERQHNLHNLPLMSPGADKKQINFGWALWM